jgi:DNA polymerase I-like protein with 3'-5' exonuclease and polymerase domains
LIYYIGNDLFSDFETCTLQQCVDWCKSQSILALDVETSRKFKKGEYSEEVYVPGLDPYVTRICMFQIGNLDRQYVIDARVIDLKLFIPILESPNVIKIIHNAKFESLHVLHNLKCRIQGIWDTMIVEKVLNNGRTYSYSLKAVAERRLGLKEEENNLFNLEVVDYNDEEDENLDIFGFKKEYIDKSIRTQFVEWGFKPFTNKQIEYGARDLTLPYRIYLLQKAQEKDNWFPAYGIELENKTTFVLAEMSYRGIPLNGMKWLETEKNNQIIYKKRKLLIDNYVETNEHGFCDVNNLFADEPRCNISWSSPKQVIALYRHWNICPKEKSKQTGKLEWSVGAKALFKTLSKKNKERFMKDQFPEQLEDKNDFTLAYLLFKKSEQLIQTFGKDWLKYVHPITHRVHSNYNQLMISTRLSASNPNVQQIPRTTDFRSCIESLHGELICTDYSSQEIFAATYVHKSKPLMKFFKEGDEIYGDDIHSFMAAKTFKVVYNNPDFHCEKKSPERQQQKIVSFQTIYGGSEYTLSESIGITVEQATDIQNGFKKGFELENSFDYFKKHAFNTGFIELDDKTQKRYFFPQYDEMMEAKRLALATYPEDWRNYSEQDKAEWKKLHPETSAYWKTHMSLKGKLERRSLNLRVQGLSASMTKKACIDITDYRWNNGIQDEFYLIVSAHDETVAEVNKNFLHKKEEFGKVIQESMEGASAFFLDGLVSKAEPLFSKYWSK